MMVEISVGQQQQLHRGNAILFKMEKPTCLWKATLSLENGDGHDPLKSQTIFGSLNTSIDLRPSTLMQGLNRVQYSNTWQKGSRREGSLCCHSISPHALGCLLIHPKDRKRLARRYSSFLYETLQTKSYIMLLKNELKKDWLRMNHQQAPFRTDPHGRVECCRITSLTKHKKMRGNTFFLFCFLYYFLVILKRATPE